MSSSADDVQLDSQPLEDRILSQFAHSKFPPGWEQPYMPEERLNGLVTKSSITEEFSSVDDPDERPREVDVDENLIDFILRSAKKLFAICLMSGIRSSALQKTMKVFKTSVFQDNMLPVTFTDPNRTSFPWSRLKWNRLKKEHFDLYQWSFLVPVFNRKKIRMNIGKRYILPFRLVNDRFKGGTFSEVWEVTVDEAHLEEPMKKLDGSGTSATAAIKVHKAAAHQSEEEARTQWLSEAKALEDINGLRHENIIEVKAIIDWEEKGNYLMFQWADGGNLRDFYEHHPKPILNTQFVKEIVSQLVGLSDALNKLHHYQLEKHNSHNQSIRHGDLKPENILRFKNGATVGVWKIADLGLARHHVQETALRGPTVTRHGTPLYEPPEVILDSNRARSRQYDIWSMGCVMLELLLWLLYGWTELESFNESINSALGFSSPYWVRDEDNLKALVHPNVVQCMEIIARDPECTGKTAIGDLLRIIKTKLLVVQLPRETGTHGENGSYSSSPSGFRAKSDELLHALHGMLKRGKSDDRYWFTGTPRDGIRGPVASISPPSLMPSQHRLNVPVVKRQDP